MQPWEKLRGESPQAYRAFAVFRDQGPSRSLRETSALVYDPKYRRSTARVPGTLKAWSSKFDWFARAWAYDAHLERVAHDAVAEHVRARATSFEERRLKLQEARLEVAEQVVERMREMASSPLYVETTYEDAEAGEITIIKQAAGWNFNSITRLDRIVDSITKGAEPEIIIDWATLDAAEIDRIRDGEDPRAVLFPDDHGRLVGTAREPDEP